MLPSALNGYASTTRQYDELARLAERRYGRDTQAVAFILYEEFIFLRQTLLLDPADLVISARISYVRETIKRIYRDGFPQVRAHPTRITPGDPSLIEFSRDVFDSTYRRAAATVTARTIEITDSTFGPLVACKPYMYVLDDRKRLLIWDRPFKLGDLVFGRNRATVDGVPVAHPMLVPERLRVITAGEVVLLGKDRITGAIFNTKSGHFRPGPSTARTLLASATTAMRVDHSQVDIFAVGAQA